MENENYKKIKEVISNIPDDKLIIIAGHERPDMDSIGSSLALTIFLNNIGKNAVMLLEEKEFYQLEWFEKHDFIKTEIIEKDYIFILMDSNNKSRLGVFEKYFDKAEYTINIDHHECNLNNATYTLSISEISSTCEILMNLFKLFQQKIDKNIAELIYSGIITDTNGFINRTTEKTFLILSEIMGYGIEYKKIAKNTFLNKSEEELECLKKMLEELKYDKFHYIVLDKTKEPYKNVTHTAISKKIIPIILNTSNINVLVIIEKYEDKIVGSLRSNCEIDVDKLAKLFNGGGHKKAAGFNVTNLNIEEILENIQKNMKGI